MNRASRLLLNSVMRLLSETFADIQHGRQTWRVIGLVNTVAAAITVAYVWLS